MSSRGSGGPGGGPKVKAFNIGKKNFPKKENDRFKKDDDDKAAAEVYEEFVSAFEEPAKQGKLFVRGAVFNAGAGEEKQTSLTGKLYQPSKLIEFPKKGDFQPRAPEPKQEKPDKWSKKKKEEKKKSNLELFKEELKIIQEEREERHRIKGNMKEPGNLGPSQKTKVLEPSPEPQIRLSDEYRYPGYGSYDTGDPNTTNLYLGNLNPKMTEQQLCEIFGKFGPLASVKIMWPRSEEERSRGRNCGFVAYMNRKDGERCLKALCGRDVMSFEMKLGWGKAVPIPPYPVYIPPAMLELTMPPPLSGLPFNAQPDKKDKDKIPLPNPPYPTTEAEKEEFNDILFNGIVKVVIPTDRSLLALIHRMIEFVIREGPLFEAMIMNREINNPMFRFLFENISPAHVYYRWRLFSVLQGEHPSKWRTKEFQMFKGGSMWKPPPLNPYHQGMPDELVAEYGSEPETAPESPPQDDGPKKGSLSESQRDKLEDMLRGLVPERQGILDAMIYCIDHAEAAEEIVDCLVESLSILQTPLHKKIARLYLISDILHNCCVKVANASFYRKGFQAKLPEICQDIHDCYVSIEGRLKAEQFKQRVMSIFRAWEEWAIYPSDFLIKLQNVFLGLTNAKGESEDTSEMAIENLPVAVPKKEIVDDIDGIPISLEMDIDGIPLQDDRDLDGIPMGDDIDGQPMEDSYFSNKNSSPKAKFRKSKWETVDPETVESQAITTSKWELLETQTEHDQSEDVDGVPMEETVEKSKDERERRLQEATFLEALTNDVNEERRSKLREIELKVMKFQDELESGRRGKRHAVSITDEIEQYRQRLIRKEREKLEEERERELERERQKDNMLSPVSSQSRTDSNSPITEDSRTYSPRVPSRLPSAVSHSISHEDRRLKLREIESKVLKFQDELESGRRKRKPGVSIAEQVERYRQKVTRKINHKHDDSQGRDSRRERTKDGFSTSSRSRSSSRSCSPSSTGSRSRSPAYGRAAKDRNVEFVQEREHYGSPRFSGSPSVSHVEGQVWSPHKPFSKTHKKSHRSRSPKHAHHSRSPSPPKRRFSPSSPSRRHHKSKKRKH